MIIKDTCKGCGDEFTKNNPLQVVCGPHCADRLAKIERAEIEKAKDKTPSHGADSKAHAKAV